MSTRKHGINVQYLYDISFFDHYLCRKDSEDGDNNELSSEEEVDRKLVLPKIIGIGLQGVFEIIKECRTAYPGTVAIRKLCPVFG